MHPVQSGKGKMYRLRSDDRIIPLNPRIDPTIYSHGGTHKETELCFGSCFYDLFSTTAILFD